VYAAEIKEKFLAAWNSLAANREQLIADCRAAVDVLCDCDAIDAELADLQREAEIISELSHKAIFMVARTDDEQKALDAQNNGYLKRLEAASKRMKVLEADKQKRQNRSFILEAFVRNMTASPLSINEFDNKLWAASIDRVTVTLDDRFVFRFKDGTEVDS
jgi:hypothetical protein